MKINHSIKNNLILPTMSLTVNSNGYNTLAIACSILFWVTPIALIIHLAIKKTASNIYKKRLGYLYGGLWAIALLGYVWLFFNGSA